MPPMTEEEALQLLLHDLKPLDKLSKDEEQASRELVKMLGYSPLAIDQARWFYSQFQFAGEIHKYIEYYKAFKDEIIKTIPTNENWGYRQTSNNKSQGWFTTFEFSLKPLIEAKNDAAVHILTISAFLGGATIWENFFREYHTTRSLTAPWSEYSNGDNRTWNTIVFRGIIADLGKRSLLLFQQNDQTMQGGAYYSLHPIIREWLRSRPESSDHDYQFEAVLMISEFIATNMDSPFPFQIQLDILTHLDSFFSETALKQKIMSKAADENSKQSIAFLFASFYRRCSRVKEAKSLLRELLDSRRQLAIEDSDPLSLDIQLELGEALGDNSEYKEAEEAFESILKFEKKLDNERHCRALLCLAALNGAQQRLRKARVLGQKVYPLVEKLSERSRLRIRSRMLLARVNGSLGYVLESARVAEQAYAEAKKLFGPVDDLALEAELLIIFNLGASGPPGQARMKLESLLQTIESRHGPEHRLTLQTIALLGEIYARGGFFKDARDCFELAKSRAETLFGDSPSAIGLEIFIARTFAGEQRNKEAEKQFKLAMKMSEQMRDTLAVRMVAGQLFYFYLMQGRLFKALPWAREFFQTFPFSHFLRTQRMFVVLPAIFIFLLGVAAFLGLGKFVLVLLVIGMITFGSQYV
jgi:tetratricopeptide (TPR) repeat protein